MLNDLAEWEIGGGDQLLYQLNILFPPSQTTLLLVGHSCNNGNAPDFVEIFLKTVICGFWMNIWYGITFTKTEKVMGKLKKDFFIYIWQNVWFFCPEETLTIFCKIKCQSFNFICQALEKSLKFAYQSYRLTEHICFRMFLKMRFFLPNLWIGNVF